MHDAEQLDVEIYTLTIEGCGASEGLFLVALVLVVASFLLTLAIGDSGWLFIRDASMTHC